MLQTHHNSAKQSTAQYDRGERESQVTNQGVRWASVIVRWLFNNCLQSGGWYLTFHLCLHCGMRQGGGEAHRQICRIGVWDLGEVIQAGVEALPGTRPTHLVVSKPLHRDVYFWKVFYYASARFAWNKSSQVSLNLQRPQTLAILASMHLNLHLQSGFRPILIGWFPLDSHHLFCLEWWNVGKEVRLRRKQELPVPSCSEKKHPRKRAW